MTGVVRDLPDRPDRQNLDGLAAVPGPRRVGLRLVLLAFRFRRDQSPVIIGIGRLRVDPDGLVQIGERPLIIALAVRRPNRGYNRR